MSGPLGAALGARVSRAGGFQPGSYLPRAGLGGGMSTVAEGDGSGTDRSFG